MSDLFFDRMARELVALFVEARRERVAHELDEEVERITGKECDDAARTLTEEEFRRVAEQAMENVRRRKTKRSSENTYDDGRKMVTPYA